MLPQFCCSILSSIILERVTIITGKINSGKTGKMLELYSETLTGGGFLCIKRIEDDIHTGYDLVFLPEDISMPFIRKNQFFKKSDKTVFNTGDYFFLKNTFMYAEKIISRLVKQKTGPVYIDELGLLELEKKCFYKSALKVIKKNIPLITCVRKNCLSSIIDLFKLKEYEIIEV